MKNKKISFPVLLVIILCGLPLLFCLGCSVQLAYFYVLEREAVPKFDALNQAVFYELPPPEGIIERERRITGTNVNSTHGRFLSVDYPMGQMTEEQVS